MTYLIVPHGVGGGFDTYARMLAPCIEEQLGCTIVVEVSKNIPDAAELLDVPISLSKVARVFVAPPDLPKDKYGALEAALQKVMADPDLLKKSATAERPIDYASGVDITKLLQAATVKAGTIKPILIAAIKAAQ